MDLTRFDEMLDKWANEEAEAAEKAKAAGDERSHSIALMKKSMYSTMLKTLGHNAPKAIEGCANDLIARKAKQTELRDEDAADRISIQIDCIRRVQRLIRELGGNI